MKKMAKLLCVALSLALAGSVFVGCGDKTPPAPEKHTHTYSEEWTIDDVYHWHASTCGHSAVSEKGWHEFKKADGTYSDTCIVCGKYTWENVTVESIDPDDDGGDEEEDPLDVVTPAGKWVDDGKTYTYNVSTSIFPSNWSPFQWETDTDRVPLDYTTMPLYDTVRTKGSRGYAWVCEMAADFPEDVTSVYKENETFKAGIKGSSQYAWRIKLNEAAKWSNGDVINADTYVNSMKLLLDPFHKNYRANSYYSGNSILANAKAYYQAGTKVFTPYAVDGEEDIEYSDKYEQAADKKFYISMTSKDMGIASYSFNDMTAYGVDYTKDGVDLLKKYKDMQDAFYGMVEYTDAMKADFEWMVAQYLAMFGITDAEAVAAYVDTFLFFNEGLAPTVDFNKVGIQKIDDYTIDLIFVDPISEFYVKSMLTSNWIVHEATYAAGEVVTPGSELITNKYGTTTANYMSYGPYKFESLQTDKEMLMTRNSEWYGYSDNWHKGQYQTDTVKIQYIKEHASALLAFESGQLDNVGLSSADMNKYRHSSNLLKTDETYTWRFVFNTDATKLTAMEAQGGGTKNVNAKIVLNNDFRRAFSYAIDRQAFAANVTAGEKPAYALLSSLYYYDIENNGNSVYRNTRPAMEAVCKLYGITYGSEDADYETLEEAYAAITGYDLGEAARLFKQAWDTCTADGTIDGNKAIQLEFLIPAATMSPGLIAMQDFINDAMKAMAKEAGLEGKLSISWKADQNAYDAISQNGSGEFVIGYCAWGGAAFYPYNTIGVYTDPVSNNMNEVGFNPQAEKMAVTADFNEDGTITVDEVNIVDTFYNWQKKVDIITKEQGGYSDASNTLKVTILAAIERSLLEYGVAVPLTTSTSVELYGKRIVYFTKEYNIFAGYGGIRQLTYTMDDAAWAEFIKTASNLNYEN